MKDINSLYIDSRLKPGTELPVFAAACLNAFSIVSRHYFKVTRDLAADVPSHEDCLGSASAYPTSRLDLSAFFSRSTDLACSK